MRLDARSRLVLRLCCGILADSPIISVFDFFVSGKRSLDFLLISLLEEAVDVVGAILWYLGADSCIVLKIAVTDLTVAEGTNAAEDPPRNVTLFIVIDERYTTKQRIVVLEQSINVPLPLLEIATPNPKARGGMVSLITLLQLALPENLPEGNRMVPLEADRI